MISTDDLKACGQSVGEQRYDAALPLAYRARLARPAEERRRGGAGVRLLPNERLAIMLMAALGTPAREIAKSLQRNILTIRRVLRSTAYARLEQHAINASITKAFGRLRRYRKGW